ncbi:MAG: hypothetical protein J6Y55_11605 [Bacteroidales bacterium]|nr:hypothetical protein [Bacteroidales bacterium]
MAKNQLRSAKGVEVPNFRKLEILVQGTNAFSRSAPLIFFNANQLSRKVVPTKNLFLMTLRIEHCSSFNDDGSPSQMSVKKIFERNVKNSRLGGVELWGAPSPRV